MVSESSSGTSIAESEIRRLVLQFEHGSLDRAACDHGTHLAVGLVYVRDFGPERALAMLRVRIGEYNRVSGRTEAERTGYREDVTGHYVGRIAQLVNETRGMSLESQLRMLLFSGG